MTTLEVHGAPMARVCIPAYLTPSLQRALAEVYAPFFAAREVAGMCVVLQEEEWRRLADRFPSAVVERDRRLISLDGFAQHAMGVRSLAAWLDAEGIESTLLPSFHRIHLLVRRTDVAACARVLSRWLRTRPQEDGPLPEGPPQTRLGGPPRSA